MCGIAGIFNQDEVVDRSALHKASEVLAHRGPDDEGFFFEGPVGLLHRRLSIIDLTGGAQPMSNKEGTIVLVFNGEIYNFIELRRELELKGHIFHSSSDTEAIVHSFEEWGLDCIEHLYGMFAFAIYDRRDKSLFLSRDRCGEKPIYYFHDAQKFVFASENQALLTMLGRTPMPDPNAIYLYLRFGYIPAPYSFFAGISKMTPGSCLLYKGGRLKSWTYYQPCIRGTDGSTEVELCDALDATLRSAVRKMLVSDVPLGAFLSGGIDSSLIVAMMAKEGVTPQTFSISFGDASFDESQFAGLASRAIGTQHTQYNVSFGDLDKCLSIMDNFGEPFADSSGIPTFYLTNQTKQKVTVALSGDGGDELFGGYRRYIAQRLADRYLLIPSVIRNGVIHKILSLFSDSDVYYADSLVKSARIFVERVESICSDVGLMLNMLFTHDEVVSLFPDLPDARNLVEELVRVSIPSDKVEALMLIDRRLYLPNDILVKVDRMSMRNSLEVRTPYLDPAVMELSERIPLSMKINGKNQKYLLKKVALRYLPPSIVFRRKHGFMVPMARWIKEAGKKELLERLPFMVDIKAAKQLLESHFDQRADHSYKIFALIILGRFTARGAL